MRMRYYRDLGMFVRSRGTQRRTAASDDTGMDFVWTWEGRAVEI